MFHGHKIELYHVWLLNVAKKPNKFVKMTPVVIGLIERFLCQDFSPEQSSGFLAREHNIQISHESIYQYVLADKAKGGHLCSHLRHGHKKRKKRYGPYDRRGQIQNRVSIDERPAIVNVNKRIGNWEIDPVIGKKHKRALLTLVERKSKFTLIREVLNKQADLVTETAIDLLNPYQEKVFAIAADNGQKFAYHESIKEQLKTDIYFVHPYHAWERGLCKNTNGLIRQYFPNGTDFQTIKQEHVQMAMNRLNNRPRKTLGYKTPALSR